MNDLVRLLTEIKSKMYDPLRVKYSYAQLTEAFERVLQVTQNDDENLLEYTKRYKQARDIVKTTVGEGILTEFVKSTSAYKNLDKQEDKTKWKRNHLVHG